MTVALSNASWKLTQRIHRAMAEALLNTGPHIEWNAVTEQCVTSSVGLELLTCMCVLAVREQLLEFRNPRYMRENQFFEETVHVQVFRGLLGEMGQKLVDQYDVRDVDALIRRLPRAVVEELQLAVLLALEELNARVTDANVNKRLYDEMFKTQRSLSSYLNSLKQKRSKIKLMQPMLLGFDWEMRASLHDLKVNGFDGALQLQFPDDHLAEFARASSFVARIKKAYPGGLAGHLIRLVHSDEGCYPMCILVLFMHVGFPPVNELDLRLLWADHIFGRKRGIQAVLIPGFITVRENLLPLNAQDSGAWERLTRWILVNFLGELKFRRLDIPARKRSWSRGVSTDA